MTTKVTPTPKPKPKIVPGPQSGDARTSYTTQCGDTKKEESNDGNRPKQ